jgi:hypothetical protein
MSKKIKFKDIKYDTDGKQVENLPQELTGTFDDDFNPAYEGADFISDKTGWCVEHFTFEELVKGYTSTTKDRS